MSFFNINFKNKNESGAIGIIGGGDGPTSIYTSKHKKNKKEKQEKFLSYAAEQITPCERTFNQLEEYLFEKYQAVPHTLLSHELDVLKANVILNHFDYVLNKPEPMAENPSVEEIKDYFKRDTSFSQAKQYPAEKLGLELKAYKLTSTTSNSQKRGLRYKNEDENINTSYTEYDVIVEVEMKSKYLCIHNGDDEIMFDLLLYTGVSEKDIRERTPRFIAYAYGLKHTGKL